MRSPVCDQNRKLATAHKQKQRWCCRGDSFYQNRTTFPQKTESREQRYRLFFALDSCFIFLIAAKWTHLTPLALLSCPQLTLGSENGQLTYVCDGSWRHRGQSSRRRWFPLTWSHERGQPGKQCSQIILQQTSRGHCLNWRAPIECKLSWLNRWKGSRITWFSSEINNIKSQYSEPYTVSDCEVVWLASFNCGGQAFCSERPAHFPNVWQFPTQECELNLV